MKTAKTQLSLVVLALLAICRMPASAGPAVGQPADIAASAYLYRADRPPDANPPESWIGLMKYAGLPLNQAVDVNAPALKKVLCGLIWEEVRRVRRVTLVWSGPPERRPKAEDITVTFFDAQAPNTIPTWWNETVLREAGKPEVSADGRTFAFAIPVDTFGLVVSVRGAQDASAYEVPTVQAFTPDRWKRMDLEVEWGFDKSTAALDYSGRIEAYDGILDGVQPLTGDSGTIVTEKCNWGSAPKGDGRRGVRLSLLYQGTSKWRKLWPYNGEACDVARTIVTVWTKSGNFSFLASDLEQGPILAPEYGFFVCATNLSPAETTEAPFDETNSRVLLDHKLNALLGNKDIRGWSTGGDTPWFAGNATDRPVTVSGITVPGRGVAMHPGADCDVGVGWRSPLDGRVRLEGHVADAQPGGDGVEWSVVNGQRVLNKGTVDSGGAQSIPPADITVSKGDTLSLVVGRRGNHVADSTAIKLAITEIGGQGRAWDLAKDVLDQIQSGNPHADSLGNPGVWSFFQFTPPPVYLPPPAFKLKSNARSAREFVVELAARNVATIRQQVRQHAEQTWDGAVGAIFPGKALPAIPKPEFDTPMKVEVPCEKLTAQWNLGAWHLVRHAVKNDKGQLRFNDHPYGILAAENYLIFRVLDLLGMHPAVADGLDQWLTLPTETKVVPGKGGHHPWAKPDRPVGLFSDGRGCLTHAEGAPLGVGGHMDGVHSMGPGAIMYPLVEHFRLTGDTQWLKAHAPRMKANVEWILRQRRLLAGVVPGGERLWCKGLQPPHQVTPDSGGQLMQFYESEAYYWLAVQRFAQVMAQIDAAEATRLAAEAEAYRSDLKAAVERSIAINPVILVRDGTYRSFIPFACYVRGAASGAWSWRRPGSGHHVGGLYWDTIQSADPLVSPARLLPPDDPRVQGHLDVLEDRLLLENPKVAQVTRGFDPEKHWFAHAAWQYQPGLERHANIHLAADDASNFLRSWLNQYAVLLLPDAGYIFREHTIGGPPDKIFEEAAFLERFRDMLIMEDGESLWLARATPRAWLEQGKKISVKNAPTHFGPASYEIASDVDHGKIAASVEMPSRNSTKAVLLRLRHPQTMPLRSVTVNGKEWKDFNKEKETIELKGLTGTVAVTAIYGSSIRGLTGTIRGVRIAVAAPTTLAVLPTNVPKSDVDLRHMALWSMHYLIHTPRPELNYEPVFGCWPLRCPPIPSGNDIVVPCDTDARMFWEWYYMREVSGSTQGKEVEAAFRRRMLGYVRDDGTVVAHTGCLTEIKKVYTDADLIYHVWGATKILNGLVEDFRRTGNEESKAVARKIMLRLKKLAVYPKPDVCYFPCGMGGMKLDGTVFPNGWNAHPAPVVEPLVNYYLATGDKAALDFASAYAEGILSHAQPGGIVYAPDGKVHHSDNKNVPPHSHGSMHALWGVAHLGLIVGEARYTDRAKKVFDWMLARGTGTGWFPGSAAPNNDEGCMVSDMISLATLIAQVGHPEYFDYADRFFRNYVNTLQFIITPEFEAYYRKQNAAAGEDKIKRSLAELRKFQGGIVGGSGLNDWENDLLGGSLGFDMAGCCAPELMRAIYTAWVNTIDRFPETKLGPAGVYVNLGLSRPSPWGQVVSFFPDLGRLTVKASVQDAFFLRPPHWASRGDVRAFVGTKAVPVVWSGAYVRFDNVRPGEELTIAYPLLAFTHEAGGDWQKICKEKLTFDWLGNMVVAANPPAKRTPLFTGRPRQLPAIMER